MLLSIVIPAWNEAESLPLLLARLRTVLTHQDCDYEILVINDGSRDGTAAFLAKEAATDSRLKVLEFSRNFGHQMAVTAGLDYARGDAVVVMDADLQDPPELLGDMIERYREGFDVVSAQRISRKGDGIFKRTTAALFYRMMCKLVDDRLTEDVGDFRLLSRGAVMALRQFRESHRFLRGLIAWLGLNEAIVPFHREARAAGESKYPLLKMLRLAWTAVTSFSAMPVRLIGAIGVILSIGGFFYLGYAIYAALILKTVVQGWTTLIALQCLFSGAILLSLGLIGDYVGRLYEEIKQRPLYVLKHTYNIPEIEWSRTRAAIVPPHRTTKDAQG